MSYVPRCLREDIFSLEMLMVNLNSSVQLELLFVGVLYTRYYNFTQLEFQSTNMNKK